MMEMFFQKEESCMRRIAASVEGPVGVRGEGGDQHEDDEADDDVARGDAED